MGCEALRLGLFPAAIRGHSEAPRCLASLESLGALTLASVALFACQDCTGTVSLRGADYPQQGHLVALLGPARRVRPRFTGFGAGPCGDRASSSSAKWPMHCTEAPPLKRTEIRALSALRHHLARQSLSSHHARGVLKAHLATSSSGLLDALLDLREATATNSAAAWNDLGAAHLLLFDRTANADELVSGLEAFERAQDLDPRQAEARFNRALVLQTLGLYPAAAKEWRELRSAERGSPWTTEISGYLEILRLESASRRSPNLERRTRGEGLIADWARREGKGPEAERALAQAVAAGLELEAAAGDRLLLDSARHAQDARGAERTELVKAHAKLAAARGPSDYSSCAGPALGAAARGFAGSPFGVWARIDQATCDFFAKDFGAARRRLAGILEETPPAYRVAQARASLDPRPGGAARGKAPSSVS
jgi:hypothetical protein